MHELSLCRAIADTVTDHAVAPDVESVRVSIGHFRQVVPSTLEYCWTLTTSGTELESCALEIEHVPAVIQCRSCERDTQLDVPIMTCGTCGGHEVDLISGDEFLVHSISLVIGAN